jgi:hypothetical protein
MLTVSTDQEKEEVEVEVVVVVVPFFNALSRDLSPYA